MIISKPLTVGFVMTLSIASNTNQIVKVSKKMILESVPRISALCHPKVSVFEAGFIDIFRAAIEIPKPIMSEARWAESVYIAIELARYPPVS